MVSVNYILNYKVTLNFRIANRIAIWHESCSALRREPDVSDEDRSSIVRNLLISSDFNLFNIFTILR